MIFVYILQSSVDQGYYVGIAQSVDERLLKHNEGGVISTKRRKPFRLVYTETFNNYSEARIREKEIKSFKGGLKFKELIK